MSGPSTPDADNDRDRLLLAATVAGGIVVLLYSVLIAGQILAPIALFAWVFVIYLLWRFVRAHERLAAAAETIASNRRSATRPPTARDEGVPPESAGDENQDEVGEPTGSDRE
jgi:hypothetical protein